MNIQTSWTFPEYTIPNRKKSWYFWAILSFAILLIYSILTANFLFGLIILMVTIILFVYHNREPLAVKFAITDKDIQIDDKNYNFKDLKNFWIIYEPPEIKNLYFTFKTSFKPTLTVPLINQNPLKVREILKNHLEENLEQESESTEEALARVLKL